MKYSKLENSKYTLPLTLEKIIYDLGVSVPADRQTRIDYIKSIGYLEVKEADIPTPPPELNGKCAISLDHPVMGETGILIRTFKFTPLTESQLEFMSSKNRAKRDELLKTNVDSINPIWWTEMSTDKKAEWILYRQALLDVTSQPGFPANIVWPKVPE